MYTHVHTHTQLLLINEMLHYMWLIAKCLICDSVTLVYAHVLPNTHHQSLVHVLNPHDLAAYGEAS